VHSNRSLLSSVSFGDVLHTVEQLSKHATAVADIARQAVVWLLHVLLVHALKSRISLFTGGHCCCAAGLASPLAKHTISTNPCLLQTSV
jgi:hypothetical protein